MTCPERPLQEDIVIKRNRLISAVFIVAALYDGLLGLSFLFAPAAVFRWFAVAPPNHYGYVQFPAALLVVFALMFAAIAIAPSPNRNLIPFGVLLKASYCGIVFFYWLSSGIPGMWKPFAVCDFLFMIFFIIAFYMLARQRQD